MATKKSPTASKKLKSCMISTTKATGLQQNYRDRHCTILSAAGSYSETESVWYPIDVLEEYISFAKATGEHYGEKISGIRIYISAHARGNETEKTLKNRLNLTMMPTIKRKAGKYSKEQRSNLKKYEALNHESFFIDSKIKTKKKLRLLKSIKKNELVINDDTSMGGGGPYPPPPHG